MGPLLCSVSFLRARVAVLCLAGVTLIFLLCGCPKRSPKREPDRGAGAGRVATSPGPPLRVTEISFAGPAGHRPDANFARGETAICLFTISKFTYEKHRAHIRADVRVVGPQGELVVDQPDMELLKGPAPTLSPGTIRSAAGLVLPPAAPAGRYTVTLNVRDILGRRAGQGIEHFTLLGSPPPKVKRLTLAEVDLVADERVPPGAVVPLALTVQGLTARKADSTREHELDLGVRTRLLDESGRVLRELAQEPLLRTRLSFVPLACPIEHLVRLPPDLGSQTITLALEVTDKKSGQTAARQVRLKVAPITALGIVNPHLHDAGGLSRPSFLLGEQVYVRFSVWGLKVKGEEVSAAVDLAVAGPDGGVYMARKDAASTSGRSSAAVARAGRYAVQIPLVLPALAPTGFYRILLRARDRFAGKEAMREMRIHLRGSAPLPLDSFKVDEIEVRERPDLPPLKGDTFGAGRTYHLVLRVGGGKLHQVRKMTYKVQIKGDLRLRDPGGKVVHQSADLFRFESELTYRPLRILVPARWTVPSDLPGGLYDLEISALDLLDDHVSQLTRRVEVVSAGPAVEVKIP